MMQRFVRCWFKALVLVMFVQSSPETANAAPPAPKRPKPTTRPTTRPAATPTATRKRPAPRRPAVKRPVTKRPAAKPVVKKVPKKPAVEVPLTLLYTTDLGGRLREFTCIKKFTKKAKAKKLDMANLLWQVDKVRQELIDKKALRYLLFNTGDNLAPKREARFLLGFEGLAGADFIAEVFRLFRYDLLGLGNHEFSVPLPQLRSFLQRARLKGLRFSAANITKIPRTHALSGVLNRDTELGQKREYFVFKTRPYKGVRLRVAAFHLVPEKMRVAPNRIKGLVIKSPTARAKALLKQIKQHKPPIDLVVVLSHLERRSTGGSNVKELARSVPGIDVIITNEFRDDKKHSRGITYVTGKGRRVYILGGKQYGRMLGRVDLRLRKRPGEKAALLSANLRGIPLEKERFNYPLRRSLAMWERTYCTHWGKKLGTGKLRTGQSMNHNQFLRYTLNMMREHSHAEIAAINKGAIRSSPFPLKHYVTKDDLFRAMPFNSKIIVMRLRGDALSSWLGGISEPMVYAGWNGGSVNGTSLESSKYYRIVTIDYLVGQYRRTYESKVRAQQKNLADLDKERQKLPRTLEGKIEAFNRLKKAQTIDPIRSHKARLRLEAALRKKTPPAGQERKTWQAGLKKRLKRLRAMQADSAPYLGLQIKILKQEIAKYQAAHPEARLPPPPKKKKKSKKKQAKKPKSKKKKKPKKQAKKKKVKESKHVKWLKKKTAQLRELEKKRKNMPKTIKKRGQAVEKAKKDLPKQILAVRAREAKVRVELAAAKALLKAFDGRWRVLVYRGCPAVRSLTESCPDSCCLKTRSMMIDHFQNDRFRSLPRSHPQGTEPKKGARFFTKKEIPHTAKFINLKERFRWSFDTSLALRFDANFISPVNLIGPLAYQRVRSDLFSQNQFAADLNLKLTAGTATHQWTTTFQFQYGAYFRSQWDQSLNPPKIEEIIDEANDNIQFVTQYRYSRWQRFKPLAQFQLSTEFTRQGRPQLSDEDFVKKLNQYRYRKLELQADFGFDYDLLPNKLTLSFSLTFKKLFANELFPGLNSPELDDFAQIGGFPDLNSQPGLSIGYRTGTLTLFRIGKRNTTFQSQGKYSLRASIPFTNIAEQGLLTIHDFEFTNTISLGLTENIAIQFELKTIFYRGTLQNDPSAPFGSPEALLRKHGPWAYWFVPSAYVKIDWGTRGQTY